MPDLHLELGIEPPSPATDSLPRLRCSGTSWSHEPVFFTIRTASPLVLECPICGFSLEVCPSDADGENDG